jgi:hypothetical protein
MPEAVRSFSGCSEPVLSCIQDLMRSAFRRAEVDKLIDIVHDTGRPEDVQRDYAATQGS